MTDLGKLGEEDDMCDCEEGKTFSTVRSSTFNDFTR